MKTHCPIYIGTNTKMYKTIAETCEFLEKISALTDDISFDEIQLFVIPSFTALFHAGQMAESSGILVGAQNMCWEEQGQYTGEISPVMLKELGIDIVMVGHSERRHVFREREKEENLKVKSALAHGFTALLCIGETQEQKDYGVSDELLRMQIKYGLKDVTPEMISKLWIAYEPVWAIGAGGQPASEVYAEQKHVVIKQCLAELFGDMSGKVPVLYGGSVNNDNAVPLIRMPHIDGLFIGRSAWDAQNFNSMIRSVLFEKHRQLTSLGGDK